MVGQTNPSGRKPDKYPSPSIHAVQKNRLYAKCGRHFLHPLPKTGPLGYEERKSPAKSDAMESGTKLRK